MTTGQKLIKARGSMSQDVAASMCGITIASLIAYESDLRLPRDEIKLKLAQVYGTSIADLFF